MNKKREFACNKLFNCCFIVGLLLIWAAVDCFIYGAPEDIGWAWGLLAAALLSDGICEISDVPALRERMRAESIAIHDEDIAMCTRISEFGLSLVKPGDGILTHCNAGPLATSRYGTAIGPVVCNIMNIGAGFVMDDYIMCKMV